MTWMNWALVAASTFAKSAPQPTPGELQRAAMTLQWQAVRRQGESLGLRLRPGGPAPPPAPVAVEEAPACDPIADAAVTPLIESAAKAQSLETKLIRAVIGQESAFRPCAVSSKGAQGLMQLMPETASALGVRDPFDPKENLEAGAKYLKQLLDKYKGDLPQALAAYNAGPTALGQAGGVPQTPETKDYVEAILKVLGITHTAQPNTPTTTPIGN